MYYNLSNLLQKIQSSTENDHPDYQSLKTAILRIKEIAGINSFEI